jgi:hypothetical protein
MDPCDITTSSLTSEPDDLTFIHTQSNLPTVHESCRTKDRFLIEQSKLPGCVPLPASKYPSTSWVWEQGIALGAPDKNKDIQRHWLCKTCYFGGVSHLRAFYLIKAESSTTKVINHLQGHDFDRKGAKLPAKKRKISPLQAAWSLQERVHNTVFDSAGWKSKYIRWTVCSGTSFREASATYHNELLAHQNPRVKVMLPTSHTTTATWTLKAYDDAKLVVSTRLLKATSGLTISFDGWTANSKVLDLLGIMVHYIDDDYKRRAVVLSLCDKLGSHTSANMADHLLSVIQDFSIT